MKSSKNVATILLLLQFLLASNSFAGFLDQWGKVALITAALLNPAEARILSSPPCCRKSHEIAIRDKIIEKAEYVLHDACGFGIGCQDEVLQAIRALNITQSDKDKVLAAVANAREVGNCSAATAACQEDIFSAGSLNEPSTWLILGTLALAAYQIDFSQDESPELDFEGCTPACNIATKNEES